MSSRTSRLLLAAVLVFQIVLLYAPGAGGTGAPDAWITRVSYALPPDTIAVGEPMPVVVSIQYSNLVSNTVLVLKISGCGSSYCGTANSRSLSGNGQYTFPPITVVPSASKSWPLFVNDWRLQAQLYPSTGGVSYDYWDFIVKVENPQKKPKLEITSIDYVKPPDTIAVGEATVAKVNVKYTNLATNTNVNIKISDTTRTIWTATVRISGTGQLTKSFTLTPTKSGDWKLKATVSSSGITTVEKPFTIKVVQPTPPSFEITSPVGHIDLYSGGTTGERLSSFSITVKLTQGTPTTVTLSVTVTPQKPSWLTVTLTPTQGMLPLTSTFKASISSQAVPGTYTITIKAKAGGVTVQRAITLVVH